MYEEIMKTFNATLEEEHTTAQESITEMQSNKDSYNLSTIGDRSEGMDPT